MHRANGGPVEIIEGGQSAWRFRQHFHAGDEIVRILSGRARLRLRTMHVDIAEGDTITVPAGTVHRFEPLDEKGWAFSSAFATPSRSKDTASRDALVERATTLLSERCSLHTNVEAIARDCAVSAGHLARAFRRATGTSLHNFHVVLSARKAKARLQAGDPVVAAALDSGFYDQAHLTREFVRTFGMTPGAFRAAWLAA